jgi:hypothetical protein
MFAMSISAVIAEGAFPSPRLVIAPMLVPTPTILPLTIGRLSCGGLSLKSLACFSRVLPPCSLRKFPLGLL